MGWPRLESVARRYTVALASGLLQRGGRLSLPQNTRAGDEQRQRLRLEGIFVEQDRVKLANYQWQPDAANE